MTLSDRQARFVDEYLVDANGTRSAIAAGYAKSGAHVAAARLLRNDKVREAIAEGRRKMSKRVEITQDMVLEGLLEEARFRGDGSSHSARVKALETLGKAIGMFTVRHELTGRNGEPLRVEDVTPMDRVRRMAFALRQAKEEAKSAE